MKYDEIVQGEVYAYSRANATTDYYRPNEAIVLERGGWRRGGAWSSARAVVDRASKDSLVLVRNNYHAVRTNYHAGGDETAPTEEAKRYSLDQARRYLGRDRGEEVPEEVELPGGWRIDVARSRDLSMRWGRWLEVEAERDARARKLMEAKRAEHVAREEARAEMENTLARLSIPAQVDGTYRRVSLSFDAMIDLLNRIEKED